MTTDTQDTVHDGLNPACKVAGIRMIPVLDSKYKVWTKKIGSGKTKVLLLHGGPGFNHEYFECFEDFLPPAGFEMYYYDQLGCCNSDLNGEDAADNMSLWTLPRYLEEVEEVRKGLGLDDFVIVGHSWGGILAIEYALKHQHEGHLRAVVVSNMSASIESFLVCSDKWKRTLSPELLAACEKIEAEEDWENPLYEKIMMEELYPKMCCRIQPWPEPWNRSLRHVNMKIYAHMQGHSEFVVTGNLKGWDSWARLSQIQIPALMIGAEHDEMDPKDMEKMAQLVAKGTYGYCPEGSHLAFWDSQEIYFEHLLKFLSSV